MAAALTRLALAKRLARWSGDTSPDDVTSTETPPTEFVGDLVAYIDQAWLDIQLTQHTRWLWMTNQSLDTVALTPGTATLALSAIDATARTVVPFLDHDTHPLRYILLKHPTTAAIARCHFVPYTFYRGYRDRGTRPSQRPTRFTILNDGTLEFDPNPDVAYTLNCDWIQQPNELALDGDTPDMPNHFHMLVVWWAMVHLMAFDERGGRYQSANRAYKRMINSLNIEQLGEDLLDEYLSTAEIYSW